MSMGIYHICLIPAFHASLRVLWQYEKAETFKVDWQFENLESREHERWKSIIG